MGKIGFRYTEEQLRKIGQRPVSKRRPPGLQCPAATVSPFARSSPASSPHGYAGKSPSASSPYSGKSPAASSPFAGKSPSGSSPFAGKSPKHPRKHWFFKTPLEKGTQPEGLPLSQFPISDQRNAAVGVGDIKAATCTNKDEIFVEEEGPPKHSPPSVSVLHQHIEIPTFVELAPNTNLNIPPPNWLFNDLRLMPKYNPGHSPPSKAEFKSSALAAPASLLMIEDKKPLAMKKGSWEVDFISQAENVKKLFMVPYTQSSLALTVHKIGSSLVLEGDMLSLGGEKKHSQKQTRKKALESKLVYYSILADTSKREFPTSASDAVPSTCKETQMALTPSSSFQDSNKVAPELEAPFGRAMHWRFRDLNLLLGSDTFVTTEPKEGTAMSLRLQDQDEPLSQELALEYWLDNVMSNVPNLAICYHKEGVVQGYQLVSTQSIPFLSSNTQFDPKVVEEYAGGVLHWLKDRCTKDAGSYLLIRERGGGTLQLFDLDELPLEGDEEVESVQEPFSHAVGMMCYRMADRLLTSDSPENQTRARNLLQKSVGLLHEEQEPVLVASAHEQLANSYLAHERVPPTPSKVDDDSSSSASNKTPETSPMHEKRKTKTKGFGTKGRTLQSSFKVKPDEKSGILVQVDSHRENHAQAAEHLANSIRILSNLLNPDIKKYMEVREMRKESIRCYVSLGKHDVGQGGYGEALGWIAKAQNIMLLLQKEAKDHQLRTQLLAKSQPPTDKGDPSMRNSASIPTDEEKDSQDQTNTGNGADEPKLDPTPPMSPILPVDEDADGVWKHEATIGILEILGDIHVGIYKELEADPTHETSPPDWLTEYTNLANRLNDDWELGGWNFLEGCVPFQASLEENAKKALRYYTTAQNLSILKLGSGNRIPVTGKMLAITMELGMLYTKLLRFSKASDNFQQALRLASDLGETSKISFLNNKVGEIHLKTAELMFQQSKDSGATAVGIQNEQHKIIQGAMTCFKQAQKCDDEEIKRLSEQNLGIANCTLGLRMLRNFMRLRAEVSNADWEKTIEDLLMTSTKHSMASQAKEGLMQAHCGLAKLYFTTFREIYNPMKIRDIAKQQEKRVKMSELYWKKVLDFCPQDKGAGLLESGCCPLVEASCGLAELHLQVHLNRASPKALDRALQYLFELEPHFEAQIGQNCHQESEVALCLDVLKKIVMNVLKAKSTANVDAIKECFKEILTGPKDGIASVLKKVKAAQKR